MTKAKERKSNAGRPTKYKAEYKDKAYDYALLGLTDKQIAGLLHVDERTFNRWKISHPEFCQSVREGREVADAKVIKSLYQRATGYTATEKRTQKNADGEEEVITVEKEIPPDVKAGCWWMQNRRPSEWRDRQEVINRNVNIEIDASDPQAASAAYQDLMGR
tara:strand:- start:161 stop:646 length:486 start_codon:yes stop_codon:yes gene_type:complete